MLSLLAGWQDRCINPCGANPGQDALCFDNLQEARKERKKLEKRESSPKSDKPISRTQKSSTWASQNLLELKEFPPPIRREAQKAFLSDAGAA